jgi:hypothetical protein
MLNLITRTINKTAYNKRIIMTLLLSTTAVGAHATTEMNRSSPERDDLKKFASVELLAAKRENLYKILDLLHNSCKKVKFSGFYNF